MKEAIEKLLKSTKREGIDDLCEYLDEIGFYSAPASTRFHGAKEGALAIHSMNVYQWAEQLAKTWLTKEDFKVLKPSIIIAALLHDVGKCGQFGKPLYVDNMLKTGQSKAQPFKHNSELLTLPHEVVSVVEITKFIDLTEEEQNAIAWHNGLYGCFKYDIQGKETMLYMLIHFSDLWASRILEREE